MSTETTEVKPPQVTPRPPKAPMKPPHPFIKLSMGRARVVLKQKGNNNTIVGACKWYRNGFLKLTDAFIEFGGREQAERVEVPWVLVEVQTIAYLRPDVAPETPKESI